MSKVALIAGGAVVVVVAAVSPFVCGISIENRFDEHNKALPALLSSAPKNANISLVESSFSRGWFSSTAKTVFNIEGDDIVVNQKITNGPWSYWGLGKIDYQFEFNGQIKSYLEDLFSGKAPITITNGISFGGDSTYTISSPAIAKRAMSDAPNAEIAWGGVQGTFSLVGNHLKTDFLIPEISLTSGKNEFNLTNLSMKADGAYFSDWSKAGALNWASNTDLSIENISLEVYGDKVASSFSVSNKTTDEPGNKAGTFFAVKLDNMQLPSRVSRQFLSGSTITQAQLSIEATGLPKSELADVLALLDDIQAQNRMPSKMELVPKAQKLALAYLQGMPSISVNTMVNTDRGAFSIDVGAKLDKTDTSTNPMALLFGLPQRLVVVISPSIAEGVLDTAFASGALPMDKDEFIQMITESDRFVLTNGVYSGKFEYKNGSFFSNGKPDPALNDLLQMVSGMSRGMF